MIKNVVWLLIGLYGVPALWKYYQAWRDRGLNQGH